MRRLDCAFVRSNDNWWYKICLVYDTWFDVLSDPGPHNRKLSEPMEAVFQLLELCWTFKKNGGAAAAGPLREGMSASNPYTIATDRFTRKKNKKIIPKNLRLLNASTYLR